MSGELLLLLRGRIAPGAGGATGEAGDLLVTVSNSSSATDDLVIGEVTIDPDPSPFAIISNLASGVTLAPGESSTVRVRFRPFVAGVHTATLRIPSSDPDGTLEVLLSGTALAELEPGIEVDPPAWDAGDAYVTDDTETTTITVTSSGTGPLTVGTIAITGSGFAKSADEATGQVIPAGQSRTLVLTFDPSSAGAKSGTLTIPSDAGADVVVALSGVGVADPVIPPEPEPETPVEVSRFYLGRQAKPSGISVVNSSWNRHTVDADNAMTVARGGPISTWGQTTNLTLGQKTRLARWIGPPMAEQSIDTTFTAYFSAAYRQSVLGENVTSAIRFGIWRAATGLVEFQSIKSHASAVEPWRTSDDAVPRRLPAGGPYTWTVQLELDAGDRIVIEAGARGIGADVGTTAGVRARWGGESTALDVDTGNEVQSTRANWIEFTDPLLVLP